MASHATKFSRLFEKSSSNIVGMIHLLGSPGTPAYTGCVQETLKRAEREAQIYKEAGLDSVIIENMHDIPYLHSDAVGPEVTSVLTVAASRVRSVFDIGPVGIQVLTGANHQALAIALATGLDYIRAEGFVYSHVADEGLMNACAGSLLRYRRQIGAEHIAIFTDIKKKHSAHSITSDVSIVETAKAAEFFLSDGVIVTGSSTGTPADVTDLKTVKKSVTIPVLIGSGVTTSNFRHYKMADALIIGSYFKKSHYWANDIDERVVNDFMDLVKHERANT